MFTKTKPAILKVKFKMATLKDHSIGRAKCSIVKQFELQTRGPDGILRLQVFCFLVKEKGHVN